MVALVDLGTCEVQDIPNTKQWASRDTLIQSAGSISNSALKMYIPGQIRISNALNSDGYSTGNAPPSGNNA